MAVVLSGETRQHGHGCETFYRLGPADKAIGIQQDSAMRIHIEGLPMTVLDGHDHTSTDRRHCLFPRNDDYDHHQFVIEGPHIKLAHEPYYLGTKQDGVEIQMVKKEDSRILKFDWSNGFKQTT